MKIQVRGRYIKLSACFGHAANPSKVFEVEARHNFMSDFDREITESIHPTSFSLSFSVATPTIGTTSMIKACSGH